MRFLEKLDEESRDFEITDRRSGASDRRNPRGLAPRSVSDLTVGTAGNRSDDPWELCLLHRANAPQTNACNPTFP